MNSIPVIASVVIDWDDVAAPFLLSKQFFEVGLVNFVFKKLRLSRNGETLENSLPAPKLLTASISDNINVVARSTALITYNSHIRETVFNVIKKALVSFLKSKKKGCFNESKLFFREAEGSDTPHTLNATLLLELEPNKGKDEKTLRLRNIEYSEEYPETNNEKILAHIENLNKVVKIRVKGIVLSYTPPVGNIAVKIFEKFHPDYLAATQRVKLYHVLKEKFFIALPIQYKKWMLFNYLFTDYLITDEKPTRQIPHDEKLETRLDLFPLFVLESANEQIQDYLKNILQCHVNCITRTMNEETIIPSQSDTAEPESANVRNVMDILFPDFFVDREGVPKIRIKRQALDFVEIMKNVLSEMLLVDTTENTSRTEIKSYAQDIEGMEALENTTPLFLDEIFLGYGTMQERLQVHQPFAPYKLLGYPVLSSTFALMHFHSKMEIAKRNVEA